MVTERTTVISQRARLTRQGQITVPKAVRDALGARPGDDLEFISRGELLTIQLRRRPSILEFAGLASRVAKNVPASAEELDEVIERGMTAAALARAAASRSARRVTR